MKWTLEGLFSISPATNILGGLISSCYMKQKGFSLDFKGKDLVHNTHPWNICGRTGSPLPSHSCI
jgi:hypothetical protein